MGGPGRARLWVVLACALAASTGCVHFHKPVPVFPEVPSERQKQLLPEYVIESPDLLQIDLLYAIPLPPYKIQPLDVLQLIAPGALEDDPIGGLFPVEPDGTIPLSQKLGRIRVAGLTLPEAQAAIEKRLEGLKNPRVTVALAEGRSVQLVRGQHLVRPDGAVSLGSYGSVVVAGRTPTEAKALIEAHLRQFLQSPEVIVNVVGYNSKVYYVIFDLGAGQQMVRLPVTGNDTVLDAMSQVNGLTAVSNPRRVWVARSAGHGEPDNILPVDWHAMTCRGRGETNYQLLPGDRIFVKAYPMVKADVVLGRVFAPFERVFGFTLLGTATYQAIQQAVMGGGAVGGSGF